MAGHGLGTMRVRLNLATGSRYFLLEAKWQTSFDDMLILFCFTALNAALTNQTSKDVEVIF